MTVRILIADDMKVVRMAIGLTLGGVPDFQVVGEAADGQRAVELAAQLHPDVVLMDVNMPRMDGVEATRRITAEFPEVRVVGLSMHEGEWAGRRMLDAGAAAYVSKSEPTASLVAAIRGT